MLISWFVVLIALLGLLLFALAKGDAKEIGRIMFFCGLLITCAMLAGRAVRVL